MPELVEQMYCSQQIVIPPKFPYILKRYCKAAIKTQPYDLLRWSFEYFKALAEKRPPPVKLRLEYPVYSTEGGLTRGCLKVLANQLSGQNVLPIDAVKAAWQGFCLDPMELRRILCLCEVYLRSESVPFLHFIAVSGGLLTKSLTHTMILLCETLTKEPDGGSAAICVHSFLTMYRYLAQMDASKDVRYINGYREGYEPPVEEEEAVEEEEPPVSVETGSHDSYWQMPTKDLQPIMLLDDAVPKCSKISSKLQKPIIGHISRSPSAERATELERQNYLRDFAEKPRQDEEINEQLRQLSAGKMGLEEGEGREEAPKEEVKEEEKEKYEIYVFDEEDKPLPLEFYGEPEVELEGEMEEETTVATGGVKSGIQATSKMQSTMENHIEEEEVGEEELTEKRKIQQYVDNAYKDREERREDLLITFEEIAGLVDRFQTANYDLGMVAGRQMSITSGEFVVQHIEREIMEYIDEQIAILPDPDLKKKKAKPEEVAMIREMLDQWLDENMEVIVPEIEEVEEEEEPIPDITCVYAVPGIGPPVDDDTMHDFAEYALDVCKVQADLFMPRNIRHFMCPPLEKYVESSYDQLHLGHKSKSKKEEVPVPTGGVITD